MGRFSFPGGGAVQYTKKHLNYEEQVDLLTGRGLVIEDRGDAVRQLKRIGYYRLSAYTYPMREIAPQPDATTGRPLRRDCFRPGSHFTDAVALHDFDHKLRRLLLSTIQEIEVSLRTQIAYHVGKRSPFAHLDVRHLDEKECNRSTTIPNESRTQYEYWRDEYDALQAKAGREDYVAHFNAKYGGEVPLWAATEFMTMGNLVGLFKLIKPEDSRRLSAHYGVKNQQVLRGWLKALNILRNHCAHSARTWNRSTIYPPKKINAKMVDSELHHLRGADPNKIYFLIAIAGYLHRRVNSNSRFASELTTLMKKFPTGSGFTPEAEMGFTPDWHRETLWKVT